MRARSRSVMTSTEPGRGKKAVQAIEERRPAEERLRESDRQLRELGGALQNIREEERGRIARELHDELGQQLTALKFDLSWLEERLRERESDLAAKAGAMKRQMEATIRSVRRICNELRPALLDDLGLGAALEWLATDFSKRTGIAVVIDLAAADRVQADAMVTALFRIVQECLTNVARHAQATQVHISLLRVGSNLELTIGDNGKGMTAGGTADDARGLIGIRKRACLLGGYASIFLEADRGATVVVSVPLASGDDGIPDEQT